MIGYLSGLVQYFHAGTVIINVNGVGYTVAIPSSLHFEEKKSIELYIHTHVREDALSLFGFPDRGTYELFEQLLTVNSVGPKSALSILSQSDTKQIKTAIITGNVGFFTSIKGLGKKTAQKLIIELKSKLGDAAIDLNQLDVNQDLVDALTNLGFTKSDINNIAGQINPSDNIQSQIKLALKLLK